MSSQNFFKLYVLAIVLLLSSNKTCCAQNWTQLGRGAGGQIRALYLHNNGNSFNLYVGSDVAGVWKTEPIVSLTNNIEYQYKYISNSDIMRFTNKFYRPMRASYTSNYLFVASYHGIHRIDLNAQDGNMVHILDFDYSWVSDIYICDTIQNQHTIYFTTGNTRVNSDVVQYPKTKNILDFYWGSLNESENFIDRNLLKGIRLKGMPKGGDAYCLHIDDNSTALPNDDSILLGTQIGLWHFSYNDAVNAEMLADKTLSANIHMASNPNGTNDPYIVTSITKIPNGSAFLITVSNQGVFEWDGNSWYTRGDTILIGDQDSVNYQNYNSWQNVPVSAKALNQILPIIKNDTLQGYLLLNENHDINNNRFCGIYYCDKKINTNWIWKTLSVTNTNDWGWNLALPAANINSAALTPDNKLIIGKNGILHISSNSDITQATNTQWQQIYTTLATSSCSGNNYWNNKGLVNTVVRSMYVVGNNLLAGEFDRGLLLGDRVNNFVAINRKGNSTCEILKFTSPQSNGCSDTSSPSISDCTFITSKIDTTLNGQETLYACFGEGNSSEQGRGYVMSRIKNVIPPLWTQLGNTLCGDPIKIIFDSQNNIFCILNKGNNYNLYYLYNGNWNLCSMVHNGASVNSDITNALITKIGNDDYIYFIKVENSKGIYRLKKGSGFGNWNDSITSGNTRILTSRVGNQLELMNYNFGKKIFIGLQNSTDNANNLYRCNLNLVAEPPINNNNIACDSLNVAKNIFSTPGNDETSSGVQSISVNNDSRIIYVSLLKQDEITKISYPHIYRNTYNIGNGALGSCWSEITNNLPSKNLQILMSKGSSTSETLYGALRGMGEWKCDICMVISCSILKPTCNLNDGSSTVISITGSPTTYLWSNGQTTVTAAGLSPGTYTVTATNNSGCSATASVIIEGFTVSANVINSCANNTGTITTTLKGGKSPFNYIWNNAATTSAISNLSAGSYTVTVTDSTGCNISNSFTVINSSGIDSFVVASAQTACSGSTIGYVSAINVTGGIAPYSYLWSDGAITSLNNVSFGSYTVTISDAAGCSATGTAILNPLNVSCTSSSICGVANASAQAEGGTPPYNYQWSTGGTMQTISNVPPGIYTVTVTDSNSCTKSSTCLIANSAGIDSLNCIVGNINCYGDTNGWINVFSIAGGTAPFTYMWSNAFTSSSISGLGEGTYTVTITDANGCIATCESIITSPSVLSTSCSAMPLSCFGINDGTVDVAASGGTPGYNYLWSNAITTSAISGLVAGTYTVTVTDVNGCIATCESIITSPSALSISCSAMPASCFETNNGTVDVEASGGTPGYNYLWSNALTTSYISGLAAGTYTLTVTDANGCIATCESIIAALTKMCTAMPVSCFGINDGTTAVAVSGGTPVYNYMWNNAATTSSISGLEAGTYTVTVTDANGCIATCESIITSPSALTTSCSAMPASCFETNNGTSDVAAIGGTPAYYYLWSNAITTSAVSGLAAGTYTVTVTDANGCTASCEAIIMQPSNALSAIVSATIGLCNGDTSGTANIIAAGGTAGYSYLWNTGASTSTIANLAAGTYTVIVTDSNGCTDSNAVVINNYDTVSAVITQTNILCGATSTGIISVNPTSGVAPFLFSLDSGNFVSNNTFSGLIAGAYTILVKDSNECNVASYSINITENPLLSAISTAVNNLCFGGKSGTINLSPFGGVAPYLYLWSNGKTTEDLSNLIAGTYTCTVTDINGCTKIHSQSITQGAQITMTFTQTNATAPLFNNGTATCIPANGFTPYRYTWNTFPAQTTQTATGLSPGNYVVTVKDNKKCARNGAVSIVAARMGVTPNIESSISANPNPGNGLFTINCEFNNNTTIICEVCDISGRIIFHKIVVAKKGFNEFEIDLTENTKGMYILHLHAEEESRAIKLVLE